MSKITLKEIKDYFKGQDFDCRHDMKGMKFAANKVAKDNNLDGEDIFKLVVENQPIAGANTHSYGFHTGTGRHLINSFKEEYYGYTTQE